MDRRALKPATPVVALTGGIAAGKSAVERLFAGHGIEVFDADQAARAVVEPGSEGLAAVVDAFGPQVLDAAGRLDRAAMRRRVFEQPADRLTLEGILHPRIRRWLRARSQQARGPYALLSIPLLAEHAGHYDWVARTLVVDAPEALQLARLMRRDGIEPALAERMLASQASRAQRLAIADDVIDNSGSPEALQAQVAALHQRYLQLAQDGFRRG